MKVELYFREDTQELKELPINEINCYYIGSFTMTEKRKIQKYLNVNAVSFKHLSDKIKWGKFD